MDEALKTHLASLDYDVCWNDWRRHLKDAIDKSRNYYRDETLANVTATLDEFLSARVCSLSAEEELIADMWDAADGEERRVMARLFLKIAGKL